ncbi:protein boule-like [Stylophora pistillata]|uniref:protein boule-like n=1 Tax=Stylophora pistillata TaxID=50429 RepID=UPI000C04BBF5|nr:protein boule-like [Stylophora pistillata]
MQVSYNNRPLRSASQVEVWTEHGIQVLNRVFIRGIPTKMTELQLEILFGGMGFEVQNVRIIEDLRSGTNKGYGFVTFRTAEEAQQVKDMGLVRWKGKTLQVDVAVKRKPMMWALQQRFAMTAGQQSAMTQGAQAVYVMAVQPDTGYSVPVIMDGLAWQ